MKRKIKRIEYCDIFRKDLGLSAGKFDIINTHFVAESATSDKREWKKALRNIHGKLKSGGLVFMSALRGAKEYKVLEKNFPAVEIYEDDLEKTLRSVGFKIIRIFSIHSEERGNKYEGFMFVVAKRS